jgi:hypothetical protein
VTYSWKEGAIKRKEVQIGQRDARPITGANKTPKPRKKDHPWCVTLTYLWETHSGEQPTYTRRFLHEADARKFAAKQRSKYVSTEIKGPGNETAQPLTS